MLQRAGGKERLTNGEVSLELSIGSPRRTDDDATRAPSDLTREELEVRRQHLKALGYIN